MADQGTRLLSTRQSFFTVANGTSTTGTIHDAGIPGESSIWANPLHDGPVPAGASDEELLGDPCATSGRRRTRCRGERWRGCGGGAKIIDDHHAYDEIVLWYEHDSFDQLNLIQVLSRLAVPGSWRQPVSLISGSARFPAVRDSRVSASSRRASSARCSKLASP